jgi:hypothetical protein
MEQESVELERSTADDPWLLDHHIEELLGALADAAGVREFDQDAVDEPLE